MTANLRFGFYNDHDDATLSVDVTTVSGFGAENTQNTIRTKTLRSVNASSTMTLTGVVPDNRVASWLHIPKHTLKGASVQLKLYSDASATVLALTAGTVAVPCYTASEPFVNSKGTNDPFSSTADVWLYFVETTYRSYKLIFSGTPSDVAYYDIGRIRLMRYLQLTRNASFGAEFGRFSIEDRVRTQGGSLRGNQSAIGREFVLNLPGINDNEWSTLDDMYATNGTTGEVSVSVYAGDGTRTEAKWTAAGTFSALNSIGRQQKILTNRIQFEEN